MEIIELMKHAKTDFGSNNQFIIDQ